MAKKKVKPLGKALNLSNEELDELAEVTDEDVIRTQERWEKAVQPWARNILLSEVE